MSKHQSVAAVAFAHLLLPDGATRPYRSLPSDFRDRFMEMGQSKEIEEHYHANWRMIVRWIDEAGGDDLRAARHAITGRRPRPEMRAGSRAKRYVAGRTLSPVGA